MRFSRTDYVFLFLLVLLPAALSQPDGAFETARQSAFAGDSNWKIERYEQEQDSECEILRAFATLPENIDKYKAFNEDYRKRNGESLEFFKSRKKRLLWNSPLSNTIFSIKSCKSLKNHVLICQNFTNTMHIIRCFLNKLQLVSCYKAVEESGLFDSLPDDVAISILSKLSSSAGCPADFINVLMTCRRLNRLALHDLVLSKASSQMFPINVVDKWFEPVRRFLTLCVNAGNAEALSSRFDLELYASFR